MSSLEVRGVDVSRSVLFLAGALKFVRCSGDLPCLAIPSIGLNSPPFVWALRIMHMSGVFHIGYGRRQTVTGGTENDDGRKHE